MHSAIQLIAETSDQTWWQRLLHPSPMEFFWGGLVLLALMFVTLMRTRWGQARPVGVCIILSVVAHILLISVLYGTRLILQVPVEQTAETIAVELIEEEPNHEEEPEAEQATFSQAPWNSTAGDGGSLDELDTPELAQADFQSQVDSELDRAAPISSGSEPPDFDSTINPATQPPLPDRPERASMSAAAFVINAQPAKATPIESLLPSAQPNEPPSKPDSKELPSHLAFDFPDLPSSVADTMPGGPGELGFDPSLQALAESLVTDKAEAILDKQDQLSASQTLRVDTLPSLPPATPAIPNSPQPDVARAQPSTALPTRDERVDAMIQQRRARLGDGQPLPEPFRLRRADHRLDIAIARGGSEETEQAVRAGLLWLADHQQPDGRWDAGQTGGGIESKVLGHDRGGAGADADTGITGLALLAFLAAGHTHLEGDYRKEVEKGLDYLIQKQAADGNLSGDARLFARMYCHGMALFALSEAYGMTGDHRLEEAVISGINYSIRSQHTSSGGWRYQPGDQGDMSQFGWQVMALKSAELAGIAIPNETRNLMHKFLASCCRGEFEGLAAYRPGEQISPTMTAEALVSRMLMKAELNASLIREAQGEIARGAHLESTQTQTASSPTSDGLSQSATMQSGSHNPLRNGLSDRDANLRTNGSTRVSAASAQPVTQEPLNLYFLYYGTLAMYLAQDQGWEEWNRYMQGELLAAQQRSGPHVGSWKPDTIWGTYGGRVYSTAMATLSLEVYYRYLPLYRAAEVARQDDAEFRR